MSDFVVDDRLKQELKAGLVDFAPMPSINWTYRHKDEPRLLNIHMSWRLDAIGSYNTPELNKCPSIVEQRQEILKALMEGFEDEFLLVLNRLRAALEEFGLSEVRITDRHVVADSAFLADFDGAVFAEFEARDQR